MLHDATLTVRFSSSMSKGQRREDMTGEIMYSLRRHGRGGLRLADADLLGGDAGVTWGTK